MKNIKFYNHYHPYVEEMIEAVQNGSIEGLLDIKMQSKKDETFDNRYKLKGNVNYAESEPNIDLTISGAYSMYNWEIFFHIPLSIAIQLSKNQRFEEAQRWFHFIFDPSSNENVEGVERFWKFRHFREIEKVKLIDEMLVLLSKTDNLTIEEQLTKEDIIQNIEAWRDNPFDPHSIGRGRPLAYQFNVVMKYLDNLIAWGDSLFCQDTMESINEAIQIYVLANNILGERPQAVPKIDKAKKKTFKKLKDKLDDFNNALVAIESQTVNIASGKNNNSKESFGAEISYFCIPKNKKLLLYWDTVADRLFKIRHCMNIEGKVRELALFEAPIDPGMLIKAKNAGLPFDSIVGNQPISNLRAMLLIQKALEITNEVKSLGNSLLSVIEKKEGEALSILRQEQEEKILTLVQDVKFLAWKESEEATKSLLKNRESIFIRYKHYQQLLGKDIETEATLVPDKETLTEENFDDIYDEMVGKYLTEIKLNEDKEEVVLGDKFSLNQNEDLDLNVLSPSSQVIERIANVHDVMAGLFGAVPQFSIDLKPYGIGTGTTLGGVQLSAPIQAFSKVLHSTANAISFGANMILKQSSYQRRNQDWTLQSNLAAHELMGIGQQVISSLIREQINKKEYEHHKQQIKNSLETKAFIKDKFSNEELYAWMERQIMPLYNTSYKFAYEVAKKAEVTMKHELQRDEIRDRDFITYNFSEGYKGLLSGETLSIQLKQMEMAYLEANKRELELTKHISLQQLNPKAILDLKTQGSCTVDIPEWLFDMETAGQYMRRIKTISLSIPCVVGTYTSINCTLTLEKSGIRNTTLGDYSTRDETNFKESFHSESIVTSGAQNDSGVFELNLRDEKYLPFEGAGVISRWKIELPTEFKQFDYNTISDVIMHMRYTARADGVLKGKANTSLTNMFQEATSTPFVRVFSLKHDFSNEWHKFKESANEMDIILDIKKEHFPYFVQGRKVTIFKISTLSKDKVPNIEHKEQFTLETGDLSNEITLTVKELKEEENIFLLMEYSLG